MDLESIHKATLDHFLDPLAPAMNDPRISEIMVMRPSKLRETTTAEAPPAEHEPYQVYIKREGRIEPTSLEFPG